ncbi:MAG: DCC1-like thiol-disulfide oxidoreductase family protein [Bdellovibrionales bacterium]|nr:DCC1-like thiol-disulfide oxidoreductase family protein [Bdellovibrionales bacterium]
MPEKTIIFFDGVCNLCDSFVNFVYKRDGQRQFLYSSLQGQTAKDMLAEQDRTDLKYLVLFYKGQVFRGPEAVQKIFCLLYPKMAWFFKKIPGRFLYEVIAKSRYKIFGKKEELYAPSPEQKKFFLS